jgi:AraC-like DNA-binding protein
MYEICFPLVPLRPFIECFWFLQTKVVPPAQLEEIIFADARADIVFSFGSPYLRRNAGQQDHTQMMSVSNLDAQRRYPVHISQQGQLHLIGVRFRPGGLAAFIRLPTGELDGLTLGLRDVFGQRGDDLEYQLFEAAGQRHMQLNLLNEFFMQNLEVRSAHALVTHVAAAIAERHGRAAIRDLSREYGYSIRTLDRLFHQVMGLSPKFYVRIARFRHTLNCLVHRPEIEWADIVSTYGYYDQPHFIKEFVEFTGIRPEAYRAQIHHHGFLSSPNHVQFLQDNLDHLC